LRGKDHRHQKNCVQEIAGKRGLLPSGRKIPKGQRRGQIKPRLIGGRVEGCPNRLGQRHKPQQRQQHATAAHQDAIKGRVLHHL
jgi:hypothetical protein